MVKGMSLMDWAMLGLTLLSMLTAYMRGLQRLNPKARKWLSTIGEPAIRKLTSDAAVMTGLTPEQRRNYVVEMVRQAAQETTGVEIPASIANYLVEHVYQSVKERLSI